MIDQQFIDELHLTQVWKAQYDDIGIYVPTQEVVDAVISPAKDMFTVQTNYKYRRR